MGPPSVSGALLHANLEVPPPPSHSAFDVPMTSEPIFPCLGSVQHSAGKCSPCGWFWKPSGCRNGRECNYCHLCTRDEIKQRRRMKAFALRARALSSPTTELGNGARPPYQLNL